MIKMAMGGETEGPQCESVDGEDGELSGDIVHAVVSARSSAS